MRLPEGEGTTLNRLHHPAGVFARWTVDLHDSLTSLPRPVRICLGEFRPVQSCQLFLAMTLRCRSYYWPAISKQSWKVFTWK